MTRRASCFRKILSAAGIAIVVLICVTVGAALYLRLPQGAAGMAAKAVCSAAFVAGRPTHNLMADDVLSTSPVMMAVSVSVDEAQHAVTARFAGLFPRRAALVQNRGCVLDAQPDPLAKPWKPSVIADKLWPEGDAPLPFDQWESGLNDAKLLKIAEQTFSGAGDPKAANARGLAVVYRGRLLLLREAPGFAPGTRLHGWSMTKTVNAMLVYLLAAKTDLSLDAKVVDSFARGREPSWVAQWRTDDRSAIRVSDLMYMRDGLASQEDYMPWGSVPRMLWNSPDVAATAADHQAEMPPGTRWRYLSSTANLLSAVARGQFATDEQYWNYPARAIFNPIGARTAIMETDKHGNWVGSSYLWASTADWARLGLLMMQDGKWGERQVLPPGWLRYASTPAMKKGEGVGYGAQTWIFGNPEANLDCAGITDIPADTVAMSGHWGQMVAMVPSRELVVVRLGWTFEHGQFDDCRLLHDVLSALPD